MRGIPLFLVALLAACALQPGATSSPTATSQPAETSAPASTESASNEPASPSVEPTNSYLPSPRPTEATLPTIQEVRSPLRRDAARDVTDEQLAALVAADSEFAFDLYRRVTASGEGNVFLSPYSISTALSMAYAGARGETATQIADVLRIELDDGAWHAARNRLDQELTMLAKWRPSGDEEMVPFTLEPVNTMFGQAGFPFRPEFLDTLAASYGAGLQAVDFARQTEQARIAINDWVAEATHDRIPDILQPDDVTPYTLFALVNAIYFKANWSHQFDPDLTTSEPFHLLDGSAVDVEMMHGGGDLQYARGDGWQAVSLPYQGASMLVVVPDKGRFAEIEAAVDAEFVRELPARMEEYEVTLGLPRWVSETRVDLKTVLEAMGMVEAFYCGEADLSGIAGTPGDICLSKVIHQAKSRSTRRALRQPPPQSYWGSSHAPAVPRARSR